MLKLTLMGHDRSGTAEELFASAVIASAMINPDKKNKQIFRMIIVVAIAVVGFAVWLMVNATARLK